MVPQEQQCRPPSYLNEVDLWFGVFLATCGFLFVAFWISQILQIYVYNTLILLFKKLN